MLIVISLQPGHDTLVSERCLSANNGKTLFTSFARLKHPNAWHNRACCACASPGSRATLARYLNVVFVSEVWQYLAKKRAPDARPQQNGRPDALRRVRRRAASDARHRAGWVGRIVAFASCIRLDIFSTRLPAPAYKRIAEDAASANGLPLTATRACATSAPRWHHLPACGAWLRLFCAAHAGSRIAATSAARTAFCLSRAFRTLCLFLLLVGIIIWWHNYRAFTRGRGRAHGDRQTLRMRSLRHHIALRFAVAPSEKRAMFYSCAQRVVARFTWETSMAANGTGGHQC